MGTTGCLMPFHQAFFLDLVGFFFGDSLLVTVADEGAGETLDLVFLVVGGCGDAVALVFFSAFLSLSLFFPSTNEAGENHGTNNPSRLNGKAFARS